MTDQIQATESAAAQRMRELLTTAARDQLRDGGPMTVQAVAHRAGVSRATAYRYLLNNDAVVLWATRGTIERSLELDGLDEDIDEPSLPDRAAALVRRAGEWAFEHERELRAVLLSSVQPNSPSSRQGRMQRDQWIETLLAGLPDSVNRKASTRLAAALTALFGSDAIVWTRDAAQLSVSDALDTLSWMAHALVATTLNEAEDDHPTNSKSAL